MSRHKLLNVVVALSLSVLFCCGPAKAKSKAIIHDAEYYVLEAQHGEKWATEDEELDKKLAELKEKHGTPPNIIHIMWDDTAAGEIGVPQIQKTRGWETPNMNKFSAEGIYFARMYTEPSCTPSRAAVMTGRHAVRNGMYNVGFPYEYGGLAADEVTMAEVLGQAGYATAFYGKSHLGDVESSYMNKQGFDEALWTPYNQVPSLYIPDIERAGGIRPGSLNDGIIPDDPYDIDKGWRPKGYIWALEGVKDGPVNEWGTPPNLKDYIAIDGESQKRLSVFMKKNVEAKKPFYAAYWPQITPFTGFPEKITASAGLLQEGLARLDVYVGQLMEELKALGIEENTLVILMSDNGPMIHNGPPGMVETLYRGGKGDFLEGGVRVTAHARWPGVIEPGQIVGDIIHETDLFTTFARLGGATRYIPTDRIIDGVDQTALFLKGDTHSRRDYVFIYTGDELAATVKGRYKRDWRNAVPGLSGAEFYDLYNDPREVNPHMLQLFTTKPMFSIMKARHLMMKSAYPDKGQNRDFPFKNIENARPESVEASKPRLDPEKLPFDPREAIMQVPEWDNLDRSWGAGN
ncbi:sulfatase-like hydrolase/transferase [Desulfoluna butyratoxydans]|uniref:Sulfatase n-terminal n=1 Tax=Desulfoluna butyratoxydans TaxID=231438 RepID=A0A4V6ILR7_9BACT|nr:sulfatase-like hydrolase/transferase [Desulfoluna butyratoxydans]VFQ46198.1 sulfatase n-terminal [Desulfoluna butyratoxydans]